MNRSIPKGRSRGPITRTSIVTPTPSPPRTAAGDTRTRNAGSPNADATATWPRAISPVVGVARGLTLLGHGSIVGGALATGAWGGMTDSARATATTPTTAAARSATVRQRGGVDRDRAARCATGASVQRG